MKKWIYYNHALISNLMPHEEADTTAIVNGSIWKSKVGKKALLLRWTTDFDCGYITNWWYCIKDDTLNLESLKSKRRYELKKGRKFFYVEEINPNHYINEIYKIQFKSFAQYPIEYRPKVRLDEVRDQIKHWEKNKEDTYVVFGAFSRETKELCGYTVIRRYPSCAVLLVQKVMPEIEKYAINAALIWFVLEYYEEELKKNFYIADGERNILHKTEFQSYLEKYFGFRKAYCHLNLAYRPGIGRIISALYPFREQLLKLDHVKLFHKINGIMQMESIRKNEK